MATIAQEIAKQRTIIFYLLGVGTGEEREHSSFVLFPMAVASCVGVCASTFN